MGRVAVQLKMSTDAVRGMKAEAARLGLTAACFVEGLFWLYLDEILDGEKVVAVLKKAREQEAE